MKIIGIDTATKTTSVAVVDNSDIITEFTLHDRRTHSEKLLPLIDQMLTGSQISLEEISGISVVRGPGSFTGLRIGISTSQGLSMGLGIPMVGIITLDVLAYNRAARGLICPLLDAKKNQVYTCLYRADDQGVTRLWPYQVIGLPSLVNKLAQYGEPITFTGDGVRPWYQELVDNFNGEMNFSMTELEHNRGALAARLGHERFLKGEGYTPYKISPYYIRKSEAERKRETANG